MARDDDGAHLVFVGGSRTTASSPTSPRAATRCSSPARRARPRRRRTQPSSSAPGPSPSSSPSPALPVSGELLSLSPRALALLDRFEGVPLSIYERRPISIAIPAPPPSSDEVVVVEAEAYYAHRSYAAEMWRRCGERGIEGGEYTPDAARAYVTRPERPSDASLLDEVRRFLAPRD
ncbi:putative gamma-glutamylcyclotransferase [Ananas comosus]|uniref:Gamma-glutamylcyclotransferase family protein n=1 Tax=Ananas comosus TaxID=4615 RepID=A0A199UHF0_ANACO|nr:putative gamma-glutamylcyclotransferase [Ananas comosus]